MFQIMNSVKSNNLSLKYKRLTLSDSKDKGVRKFQFVAKTQFLFNKKVTIDFSVFSLRKINSVGKFNFV